MQSTTNPVALLLLAIVVLLAVKFLTSGKGRKAEYSFIGCPLLSENQIRFYRVLQMAVPNDLVFPQIGMAALVQPRYAVADFRFKAAFRTISQKRIDFVVCNRNSMEVRCLVELDDSTHDARRDQARDAITVQAGYRTVRVRTRRRYDIDGLRNRVLDIQPETARVRGDEETEPQAPPRCVGEAG
jgi:very-short-patch-repair endonuclease